MTTSAVATDSVLNNLIDELTAKLQTGELVDLDAVVAEHPEHADALRRLVPALQVLADLSRNSEPGTLGELPSDLGELGDFRLIREVGRGGMGIVYEAEQNSLCRKVALKVLPFAATMDPRQLQRFRNEAQAAACLHHPNIVPVHGVGVERGVHYYAMQLIEGQTLAQAIAASRAQVFSSRERERPESSLETPVADAPGSTKTFALISTKRDKTHFRHIASLIASAADALEYAHSMGVLHRDIKPGNLMLDNGGQLWITDFGLAKVVASLRDAEPGCGATRLLPDLTLTGDMIGTLRYMSPEAALAKHGLVDHRTDIYSLGATLYELLTLQPAVRGDDKAEILNAIAWDDPTPLRKLDKSIPAELETITLKCLAKEPGERYATAGDLARDLRNWLDEKPIQARPPGWREHAAKWGRRHRGFVAASIVVLAVALAASSVSTFVIWQKEAKVRTANEALARERDRAQANLSTARQAIGKLLTNLGAFRLMNVPQVEKIRAQVCQDAVEIYRRLIDEQSTDRAVRMDMAMLHGYVFAMLEDLGRKPEAEAAVQEKIRICRELAGEFPNEPKYRLELAGATNDLATLIWHYDNRSQAEELLGAAIGLQETLIRDDAGNSLYANFLARMLANLGFVRIEMSKFEQAEPVFRRAIAIREKAIHEFPKAVNPRQQLAAAQCGLALVLSELSRIDEAEQTFQVAVATEEKLVTDSPDNVDCRKSLADTLRHQGLFFQQRGRLPEAEAAFKKAIPHFQKLAADYPNTPANRFYLGKVFNYLGELQADTRRPAEAQQFYRQGVEIFTRLLHDDPQNAKYKKSLAQVQNDLAWLLATCPQPSDRDIPQAVELAKKAVATAPANRDFHNTLGVAHYRAGDWHAAVAELEKSMQLSKGGQATDWFFMAMAQWQLGNHDEARKLFALAAEWMEKNESKDDELRRFRAEAAELLRIKEADKK